MLYIFKTVTLIIEQVHWLLEEQTFLTHRNQTKNAWNIVITCIYGLQHKPHTIIYNYSDILIVTWVRFLTNKLMKSLPAYTAGNSGMCVVILVQTSQLTWRLHFEDLRLSRGLAGWFPSLWFPRPPGSQGLLEWGSTLRLVIIPREQGRSVKWPTGTLRTVSALVVKLRKILLHFTRLALFKMLSFYASKRW